MEQFIPDIGRDAGAVVAPAVSRLRRLVTLPHVFVGLSLNAPVTLTGAIVAEFFGAPGVGRGFRGSAEAARRSLHLA
ncbi:MAG: hypothetical protein NT133_19380 [Alphaproteobacteria bacterium]|nr:hypothetical protein [Alphaproteobacteria bacterium]